METSDTICRLCKARRIKDGKEPRKLIALPSDDPIFQNKATPVFICEVCDGDVLRMALKDGRSDT